MTQIIGGHNLGLFDGSFTILNRNDQTGRGTMGHGAQAYGNVSNGNLVLQERDVFLPSFGEDFNFVRTYNSRGVPNPDKGWWFSPNVMLTKHNDHPATGNPGDVTNYSVTYGDGSELEFVFNAGRNLWISTDGAGSYETLEVLPKVRDVDERYLVTRADRSQYLFDKDFNLLSVTDANGVATTFEYKGKDIIKIRDDTGHVLSLTYAGGRLVSISDETNAVLVQYAYTGDLLTQVTDRMGHVTRYHYNNDKLIDSITLPDTQKVNNLTQTYATRTLTFTYAKVKWEDHPHHETDFDKGDEWVVTQITDSNGGTTTFEYNFIFGDGMVTNDRDLAFKPNGGRDFQGGTTRVVDALGNARAYSNDQVYKDWRVAHGYYQTYTNYDPKTQAGQLAQQNAQAELIRKAQAVTYTYDPNGQITKVKDELGFETSYAYDVNGNLTSITDANGWGATNSDSAYYLALRRELGYVDGMGNAKLAAALTETERTLLLDKFTSRFTYDGNGNLLTSRDNVGNVTTYTYTAFNQIATITTAMGHKTQFFYDSHQNLTQRIDALGNITDFFYDTTTGLLTKKILYLDKDHLSDTTKQQVTTFEYDAFGNNTKITDAMGNVTIKTYDHFGNLIALKDARNNTTNFAYDLDDRLLSMTDAEGHRTSYAYDSVGNKIAITDANGHVVTQVFDKNNMLITTIDPSATAALTRTTQYTYDILGNYTQTTDAEGRKVTYAYDAHRQLVDVMTDQVKDANNANVTYHETYAYDGEGNTITQTDRRGNSTQYLFTVNGQRQRMTDAVGNVTEYSYNAELRQIQITVGAQLSDLTKRRQLNFNYDDEGRLITETDGIGNVRSYSYDAPGSIVSVTDGRGKVYNFEFDLANRLIREIRPGRDPVTNNRYAVTYEYDGNNNRITTTDENGKVTRISYDRDDRAVLLEDGNGVKTVYAYDSRDNRTSISIGVLAHMDANNHVVIDNLNGAHVKTFGYDEFNQLLSETDGLGFTESYTYDRVGNRLTVTDRLTRVTAAQYDALNRAVVVTEAQGTAAQRITTNRYDGNDNLVKTITGNRETSAVYDAMNRVIEDKDALGNVTRYILDSFGNVVTRDDGFNLGVTGRRTTSFAYDTRGRMTLLTDAAGTVTKFEYDLEDHLIKRTTGFGMANVTARVETFEYNDDGRLSVQINGAGNRTEFTYDGAGNRTGIVVRATNSPVAAVLRSNSFEYDGVNRLKAEIDGKGVHTEYRYDASGNKIEVIQAAGLVDTGGAVGQARHTLMFYDAADQLVSVVDPIGWARAYSNATEFQAWRTARGYPGDLTTGTLTSQQITDILNTQRTSYAYDRNGDQTTITEADGTVTNNTFDELGRLVTNVVGVGLNATAYPHGGVKTVNTYDAFDNVLTSMRSWADGTDARTTTYTYDALDHQTSVTDGEGFKTIFEYDAFGNQTRIQRGVWSGASNDAKKLIEHIYDTALTYDAMDRLLTTTDARGNRVSNRYDAFGNRVEQTRGQSVMSGFDAAHVSTLEFKYDGAGRMTERTNPTTHSLVRITYDAAGNQTEIRTLQSGTADTMSAVWTTQTMQYDGNGRIIASIDSYGTKTQYNFDAAGNLTSVVFAKNVDEDADTTNDYLKRTVASEYDLDNNRTATIDALLNRTTFAYDAVGNMVKRTDANGSVTRFYYDAFARVTAQLDARNFLITLGYDSAGNVTQTRTWMMAISGAISDSTAPTPTADANDRITSSQYDLANRMTRQVAPDGSYKTFEYDSTSKLIKQTQYGSTNADMVSRTSLTAPRVMKWRYDDSGRLVGFTNVGATTETETYAYDAANNKISQTIHNPDKLAGNRDDPDRTTTFSYDADNRLTLQVFDPDSPGHTGLKLQQSLGYDLAGNVVSKTDARLKIITTEYDRENRITRVYQARNAADLLGSYVGFTYDALGNKTGVRDAKGNTTTLVYDKNNRVTLEMHASVSVSTWVLGVLTTKPVTPTITTTYDSVGNVRQITDALGFVTTRWYDATGNVIAERNGDGAVRKFTYDGLGKLLTVTQDMQFHTEAVDTTPPQILGANPHVVTNTYDLGGRVVQTTFSQITVTTLSGAGPTGTNPTSSPSTVTPTEYNYYDAFGNLVESIDRNGNHSYAWYDSLNRQIATLDAGRYLIETDYDDQNHVVQQRKYKTQVAAWNPANGQRAATKPTAPDSSPVKVDRIYDAASRLIEEWSPAVHTSAGDLRVVTRFTYDAAGNMTSKTLNYATIASNGVRTDTTTGQRVEYYYYDNMNRRGAVVGADRVLNVFTYDANGNLTSQKRYWFLIPTGFTLSAATLDTVKGQVIPTNENSARDQETLFEYDEANKLIKKTERMNLSTTSDDLVNVSAYDENGNLTYRKDPDNYVTMTRYDAAAHVVETVAPNGSHSFIQYDTGGLKVRAWTGGASGAQAPVALIQSANVGSGANAPLVITWNQSGGAGVTSWVAWGTSHPTDSNVPSSAPGVTASGGYEHATGEAGRGNGISAQILTQGGTIYFRVVTKDAAGNLAWTEEQSVYVPPRISTLSIKQTGTTTYVLTATFDTPITSTALEDENDALVVAGSNTSGNTYTFTFTGTKNDDFHIKWIAGGVTYRTTNVKYLAASGPHVDAGNGAVTWPLPTDGTTAVGNGQFVFLAGQLVADKAYIGASTIGGAAVAAPTIFRSTRPNNAQLNFQAVSATGLTITAGTSAVYDVLYGNLNASTHSAAVTFTQVQHATVSNVVHNTSPTSTTWDVSWANQTLTTNVSATFLDAENSNISGGVHFDYRLSTTGVGGFTAGATDTTGASGSDHTYSAALTTLTPGSTYDIKISYTSSAGEVIVEFRRITVPGNATVPGTTHESSSSNITPTAPADVTVTFAGSDQSYSGDRSITVLAQETGGSITRGSGNDSGKFTNITVGTYVGPVNPGTTSVSLTRTTTSGTNSHTRSANGFDDKTYFTEIVYNAVGAKIGSNEDSGLWRRFGVDANGNVVETRLYGTQEAETAVDTPIKTFKQYDTRDLEIASWGAVEIGGNRGVTRTTYDYARQKLTVLDPGNTNALNARTYTYDDVGNVVTSTDALNLSHTTTTVYSVFGQWVSQTDASNHARRRAYDSVGLLTEEYVDGPSSSKLDRRSYTYDAFGRRVTVNRGVSGDQTTITLDYDQRDRVTTVTDELSDIITYYYDGRDNKIWTKDAMGRFFGAVYDGMNLLTHKYSFQTRWTDSSGAHTATAPTTIDQARQAVTNSSSALRDEVTTYDVFGNKLSVTDEAGHHQFYTYGAFGRLISVSTDPSSSDPTVTATLTALGVSTTALVTNFTYDRFGHRTGETSNYGKAIAYTYDNDAHIASIEDTGIAAGSGNAEKRLKTTFTYDLAGRRLTEVLQKGSTLQNTLHSYAYTYNASDWMLSWTDSATGIAQALTYDAIGNVDTVTGQITGNSAYFVSNYDYDNANRVTSIARTGNGAGTTTYEYDARGRRFKWIVGNDTTTYTYDEADRVTQAAKVDSSNSANNSTVKWVYDRNGDITLVRNVINNDAAAENITYTVDGNGVVSGIGNRGSGRHYTWYQYDSNNVSYFSESDKNSTGYTQSTSNLDQAGNVVATVITDAGDPSAIKTYTYTHLYNADGTEALVGASGSGDISGSQKSTYDVNRHLVHVDLGKRGGDEFTRNETKDFEYDNEGHIIKAIQDPGKDPTTTTHYLYANGDPAGEYSSASSPTLDTGAYSVIRNVPGVYGDAAPDFPSSAVAAHIVAAGETLQSIASLIYGHPELWFVIADANGLTGSEQLTPGMRLVIPNSVQYAGFNTQTHTIYQEGDIVGSKLPNLKSPPPQPAQQDQCAVIAAIILIVVVAIVAIVVTVLTVGAAAPAAAAALGVTATSVAGIIIGVAVGAVIGAAIAFTASVITQGILIGFGLQEEFDWTAVAADTVAGAFSGAAVGLGSIVRIAETATTMVRIANVVGQTALQVGGEVSRQVIISGHVDDWTGVALAGLGGALGSYGSQAERDRKVVSEAQKIARLQRIAEEAAEKARELDQPFAQVNAAMVKASEAAFRKTVPGTIAHYVGAVGKFISPVTKPLAGFSGTLGKVGKLEQQVITLRATVKVAAAQAAQAGKVARAIDFGGSIAGAVTKEYVTKGVTIAIGVVQLKRLKDDPAATRASAFSYGIGGSFGAATGLRNLAAAVYRSVVNTQAVAEEAKNRRQDGNAAILSPPPIDIDRDSFTHRNAAADFADIHQRRHGWVVTNWADTAASSASLIVSGFSIDQNADLRTALDFNRLLVGETSHFTRSSISSLAAGTVGHVATNPIPLPIVLLNDFAPSARG